MKRLETIRQLGIIETMIEKHGLHVMENISMISVIRMAIDSLKEQENIIERIRKHVCNTEKPDGMTDDQFYAVIGKVCNAITEALEQA